MAVSPMKQFYLDRYMKIRSFARQLALMGALSIALLSWHSPGFYRYSFAWWHLCLIPLGVYVGGMSAVFIHNATHNSFPNRLLNEACGWLAGLHQLWGFTGWRLIHLVHHQYSDNVDMDPHPPSDKSFWQFARGMFYHSSRTISSRYREHWGDNAQTVRLQKTVNLLFPIMTAVTLAFWFLLLGTAGFVFFYIPSYVANHLLFVGVNYTAHPKDPATGQSKAANLDHTLYFKLANFFWCGIYYHANHHRKPQYFNPKYMPESPRRSACGPMDMAA
jgi:fatty acid desaturase